MKKSDEAKLQRRDRILEVAEALFREHPIEAVPLDRIVQEAGIAKGTFYLYFSSKQDLLVGLAENIVDRMAERALDVVEAASSDSDQSAIGTLIQVLATLKAVETEAQSTVDSLERPENLELHERINVEFVRRLGPILAMVVERGCERGEFDVADSVSTVQFLLAGQAFLLGNPLFGWDEGEQMARILATVTLAERALGASPNSMLAPLAELFGPGQS